MKLVAFPLFQCRGKGGAKHSPLMGLNNFTVLTYWAPHTCAIRTIPSPVSQHCIVRSSLANNICSCLSTPQAPENNEAFSIPNEYWNIIYDTWGTLTQSSAVRVGVRSTLLNSWRKIFDPTKHRQVADAIFTSEIFSIIWQESLHQIQKPLLKKYKVGTCSDYRSASSNKTVTSKSQTPKLQHHQAFEQST